MHDSAVAFTLPRRNGDTLHQNDHQFAQFVKALTTNVQRLTNKYNSGRDSIVAPQDFIFTLLPPEHSLDYCIHRKYQSSNGTIRNKIFKRNAFELFLKPFYFKKLYYSFA